MPNVTPPVPIIVWRFDDAPAGLRAHFSSDDADWLALVPVGMPVPAWMDPGSRFAPCKVSTHRLEGGCVVVVGRHA